MTTTNPLSDAQRTALREVDKTGDQGLPYGAGPDKIHWKTGTALANVGLVHIEAGDKAANEERMVTLTALGRAYLDDDADAHRQVSDAMWEASAGDGPRQIVDGIDPAAVVGNGSARTTAGAGHRTVLGEFEGDDVVAASIVINKAGDGLSEPMDVEPMLLHRGDRGTIALEYEVEKVRFDPIKGAEGQVKRVQILKAVRATFIDSDEIRRALDEQERRVEEAQGVQRLPLDAPSDDEDTADVLAELEGAGPDQPDDEDGADESEAPF